MEGVLGCRAEGEAEGEIRDRGGFCRVVKGVAKGAAKGQSREAGGRLR